jgi:hypothetical protein
MTHSEAMAYLHLIEGKQPTLLGLLIRREQRKADVEGRLHRERTILRNAITRLRMGADETVIRAELAARGVRVPAKEES